ncbi:MAG: acetyl-CoA C-acyltransferase [Desulfobacterales bacterium]|nr:acetyl-CoA C-acyltransferase [Desulfobacterales bacterium]
MPECVIVEAKRTPIGRGKPIVGWLSGFHSLEVLYKAFEGVLKATGVDRKEVQQIISGTVTQAGEQSGNNARHAWLLGGDNYQVGAVTCDCQCGSAMQSVSMMNALIQNGTYEVGIASGLEHMSHVGLGQNVYNGPGFFMTPDFPWDCTPDQFASVVRICKKRGFTREMVDRFGVDSHTKALKAQAAGIFDREIIPIEAPILDENGQKTGETRMVTQDQGPRESTMEGMAKLKVAGDDPNAMHHAGNASQISDGASAVLMMTPEKAKELGCTPKARLIMGDLTGADPYYLLEGPIDSTRNILRKTGMTLNDMDIIECNEAFAGVVLAWCEEMDIDPKDTKLNPNGGAIAIGHPVGSTGTRLLTTALYELERTDKNIALCTMCCGSSVGTSMIIERI